MIGTEARLMNQTNVHYELKRCGERKGNRSVDEETRVRENIQNKYELNSSLSRLAPTQGK